MIYLLLNVVFGSAFLLIIKWVQVRQREDIITIGTLNYITAALVALAEMLVITAPQMETNAVLTGGAMGLVYFIAFFFVIYCVRWIGASASTVVSVLSILLPIAVAAVLWNETPANRQVFGIALALVSLSLIGRRSGQQAKALAQPSWLVLGTVVVFFFLFGFSRLAQVAFKHLSSADQRPTYLLAGFVMAAIPSLVLLVWRRKRIMPGEWGLGILLGSTNILQTHFILKALEGIPGFIVFPLASAGAILLTTLVATRVLHEKLTGLSYIGITVAIAALFLLNDYRGG